MSFEISKEHFETVKCVCEAYHKKVCEFIKDQPKIGEWISCSKRLPEEHDNIFAKLKDTVVFLRRHI